MRLSVNDFRQRIPLQQRTVAENLFAVTRGLPDTLVMGVGCLLIVGGLWGVFGIHNGFGTETLLIFLSDHRPGFDGFFYPDPPRIFTSFFYHLSYVLGSAFGVQGSFVPYQLVYGALWMLRGLLSYVIVLRLMAGRPALAMFTGVFAVLHTADGALNWVGQLNQFGFIFLMLVSFLLLLLAFDARRLAVAALAAFGSAGAACLSIWSYESPLPVMIAFPAIAGILRRDVRPSRLTWASAIYLTPLVVFVVENLVRYLSSTGGGAATYQMAVVRHDYSWVALIADLELHLKNSIAFWHWPNSIYLPEYLRNYGIAIVPVMIGAGLVTTRAVISENRSTKSFRLDWQVFTFACTTCLLLIASYLVILVLKDNRHLWRTEFLPSFAAASIMAAALYSLLHFVPGSALRAVAAAPIFIAVSICATLAGVNSALNNGAAWERQRAIISSIVSNIPDVADGTLFVVRNINRHADPFGYNEYLDLALHLAYPGRKIAGIYFFDDSGAGPGKTNVDFNRGSFRIRPERFGNPFEDAAQPTTIEHVVVFDYDPSTRTAGPVAAGSVTVGADHIPLEGYDFCAAVAGSRPAAMTLHRYGPIEAAHSIACPTRIVGE